MLSYLNERIEKMKAIRFCFAISGILLILSYSFYKNVTLMICSVVFILIALIVIFLHKGKKVMR